VAIRNRWLAELVRAGSFDPHGNAVPEKGSVVTANQHVCAATGGTTPPKGLFRKRDAQRGDGHVEGTRLAKRGKSSSSQAARQTAPPVCKAKAT
jgi:hypothetical protein